MTEHFEMDHIVEVNADVSAEGEQSRRRTGISTIGARFLNSETHSHHKPMTQTVIEKALRVRILTGFSAIILLTLLIAAWSYYHISLLGASAEHLFIANYRSIQYANAMEQSIERQREAGDHSSGQLERNRFAGNIALEYKNITEDGELALTHAIDSCYDRFLSATDGPARNAEAEILIDKIDALAKLNEHAMFARSEAVKQDATFAKLSTLGITGLLVGIAILLAVAVSRRSLAEFRELDRAKSNFVATAAHELKNPLSSIKTTTGLLLDGIGGPVSTVQSDLLGNVRTESERLLTLVRELLDLARLETGTLKLNLQPIDVYSLIESATVPVLMQAERAGVDIDILVAQQTPEISVDPNKIGWAITNLLLNAIRYSPRDSQVLVTASPIDNEVWIAVTDMGAGLSQQDTERIFEKFVQVADSAMGGGVGSGLGLSIAREVVMAHKGRIWADSTPGKGATFTIAIPINNLTQPKQA